MTNTLRYRTISVLWLTLLAALPVVAQSQGTSSSTMPHLVMYSGVARDASGNALTGTVGITFALYSAQQGGAPLWLETQNVQPDSQGRFSVYLGATKANGLPEDMFVSGEARWLGVQPQGQAEQPRAQLISVPYAMKAGDAETIGGLPPSAFVLAAPSVAGGSAAAVASSTSSSSSTPPPLVGSGTVNFVPLWTPDGNTLGNSVVFQSGTGSTAKIGVNTTTPASTLDVKGAGTLRGTLSLPAIGNATTIGGKNSQQFLQTASSFNSGSSSAVSQNFRWQAEPTGNNTTSPSGTLNLLFNSGNNPPAETGLHIGSNGQITFAAGQTFPGTGNGTITGVTAGTDLTGGGTTGTVTLNLDTSKVAQLGSNSFVGDQNVAGNVTASATVTGSAVNTTGSYEIGGAVFAFGSTLTDNTFLGFAGNSTTTGSNLTGVGYQALHSDTSASYNTALGYQALYSNNTGASNVATEWNALFSNTSGSVNTATGTSALQSNQTGWNNTATGEQALYLNTSGQNNTATGAITLNNNVTGNDNVAEGFAALFYNTGNQNTASGSGAGQFNTTGSDNTSIGFNSGYDTSLANTTGSNDTFLGANSGTLTTTNLNNATAIGANAAVTANNAMVLGSISGVNGATADTLVGIGTTAPTAKLDVHGTANFTGLITFAPGQTFPGTGNGTITGVTAGAGLSGGGTSGSVSLSVPSAGITNAMLQSSSLTVSAGTDLTGGGLVSLGGSTTLSVDTTKVPQLNAANTFTGNQTVNGTLTSTGYVTGAGFQIGSNLFGFGNYSNADSFVGFAGNLTQTGFADTGTGTYALLNSTSGAYDTANGYFALLANSTGSTNTALGAVAMANNISGSSNTGAGFGALEYNTTGNSNSAFGYGAGPTSNNTGLSNTTAIGANAEVDTSNSMVLGSINGKNGATADTNVGIGTTAPVARLHIGTVNDTTIGLRVEGPSKSGTGAFAASFGGFGDFAIDGVGLPGGRFVIKENGRVGIGTDFPDNTLSVNGSADKTGGGSWGTFSDRRLKNLDGTFSSGLSEVLKINPIRYRYKEQNGMGISDHEEHIGVVAQEIQKVIPEAVSENSKGYLLVNNDPIIWAMLNAIKEQQRQIQAQGEQIKQQQKQIRLQKKRLEEQESATAVLRQQLHQQRAHNAALESRLIHLENNQSAGATRIALNQKSLPLAQSRNER